MRYAENLHRLIARALIAVSPYAVSEYLEPVLGPDLALIVSLSVAREYASKDLNVLKEFNRYVGEILGEHEEFKELREYIDRADDESLFKHVVLREVREILEESQGRVDKERLWEDVKALIRVVGSLHDIEVPTPCRDYVNLTIVRVGRLDKVMLKEWERYAYYVRDQLRQCPKICLLYTSPSPRDLSTSRMPSSA